MLIDCCLRGFWRATTESLEALEDQPVENHDQPLRLPNSLADAQQISLPNSLAVAQQNLLGSAPLTQPRGPAPQG